MMKKTKACGWCDHPATAHSAVTGSDRLPCGVGGCECLDLKRG